MGEMVSGFAEKYEAGIGFWWPGLGKAHVTRIVLVHGIFLNYIQQKRVSEGRCVLA